MRIAQTQLRNSEAQALLVMIILDVCFLALSFIHAYTVYLPDSVFAVTTHQSYAEVFQYAKIFACVLILGRAWLRGRETLLLSWALLFVYLLLVDALDLHHILAQFTIDVLNVSPIRGAQIIGAIELLWAGGILLTFIIVMMRQFSRSHDELKQDSLGLAFMVTILVLFTFMLDHLQSALKPIETQLFYLAAIVEDFGGMITMSLAVIGVHLVFVRTMRSKRHAIPHNKSVFSQRDTRTTADNQ